MKITIIAKPNSKIEKIEKINDNTYKVYIKTQPIENKANQRIIELLAKYFDVPKSDVSILTGQFSKQKIIKINL